MIRPRSLRRLVSHFFILKRPERDVTPKSSAFRGMPPTVTTLMSLFPLLKHHLFASPPHHHIMSQSTEDREEAIQSALEDIREEICSNVAKIAVAFGILIRFFQRRVRRSGSYFDSPVINKALNEAQKKRYFNILNV